MPVPERGSSAVPPAVVTGVAAALLLLSLVLIGVRAATPTDEVFVNNGETLWRDGRMTVQWPTSGGIPPGRQIKAIQGHTPIEWAAHGGWLDQETPAAAPHDRVTYLVGDATGEVREVTLGLHRYPVERMLATNWPAATWVVLLAVVSGYLLRRRPRALVAQLLALAAALQAVAAVAWVFGFPAHDLTSPPRMASWVLSLVAYQLLWSCAVHFTLVFPVRQPLAVRHRWLIPAVYLAFPVIRVLVTTGTVIWSDADWHWASAALTPSLAEQVAPPVLLVTFLLLGYRACADPALRGQLRLVGLATTAAVACFACLVIVPGAVAGQPLLTGPLQPLLFLPVALTIVAAVLRHQMLDITVVVNRSAVWLAMTVIVVGGYAAVVSVLSLLFAQWFNPVSAVVASGVVAMGFQPVRQRVQVLVDRCTYGERDPQRLAARLSEQIERGQAPEEALSEAVRLIGDQLRLPGVAVELTDGTRIAGRGCGPDGQVAPEPVPLTYRGEPVAHLLVRWRPDRGPSQLDRALLAHLAPRLGTVAHVAQLTADVRRSRERVVLAREEERRRIYRDLHDGTAATLAATVLHLQIAQAGLAPQQSTLKATLGRLVAETQSAAQDVRRLLDDLSPPVLQELGLVKALQEKAITFSTRPDDATGPTIVVSAGDLPPLPAAVQVAAFRIAVEAMVNVVRHAGARRCTVRLSFDGSLRLHVRDDGFGLPRPFVPGVGVRSMRERAAELGGSCTIRSALGRGTELVAALPVPAPPLPGEKSAAPTTAAVPAPAASRG